MCNRPAVRRIAGRLAEIQSFAYENDKLKVTIIDECPVGGSIHEIKVLDGQDSELATTLTTFVYQ